MSSINPGQSDYDVVADTLTQFASLIGIDANELAQYDHRQCQILLRTFLACQTSAQRTEPQHVVALASPHDVDELDFNSDSRVWDISSDMDVPPAFYIQVAKDARIGRNATRDAGFQKFTQLLNASLTKSERMKRNECFLVFHLLNVPNARQVLEHHFNQDGHTFNQDELNRVCNVMQAYKQQCQQHDSLESRERVAKSIATVLSNMTFPMFARGDVYIGMCSNNGANDNNRNNDSASVAEASYPMVFKASESQGVWSMDAEQALCKDTLLEAYREATHLAWTFPRQTLWKQAVIATVVHDPKRQAFISQDTMSALIGRKQREDSAWEAGQHVLENTSYDNWNTFWNTLDPHYDANGILRANAKTLNQAQCLYNALCNELGSNYVSTAYSANAFFRLLLTSHLPDAHQARLLTPAELKSRPTLRAITRYRKQCPHLGRAMLQALAALK